MTTPEKSSGELMGWLWRDFLRRHLGWLALALLFMVIEGSMVGGISYMMQPMFDQVFVAGNSGSLMWVSLAFFVIFSARGLAGVGQKVLLSRIAFTTGADMRRALLNRLINQDTGFHQTHPPGFLIQRIQTDVNAVNAVWQVVITGAGKDFITLVALLAVAINVDWRWTAVMLVGVPLVMLPIAWTQRYVRKKAASARDLGATLATRLDEIFHGIVPIKLNRLEEYQERRFGGYMDTFVHSEVRAALGTAAMTGLVDIMAGLGFMAVLLYGGAEIIEGDKSVGQFMSFFTAIGLTFEPVRRLAGVSAAWQVAAAALERLKELIDAPILLTSPVRPVPAPKDLPGIELSDVHLNYGEAEILRGLTLSAEPGKTTALVGASGAGKSTVFNLLTRLVDPQSGKVQIGGVEARAMALGDLRDLYSVVTQEALLFDETLRENILLGRTDVTEAQLKSALDAAHVSDFLAKLPEGLDTPVGPRGSALSGGQRQRVVIARALLHEATSALDAQSEQVVQAALERLSGGRTTLVIAHRLSTIRKADKIVVMDRGRVVDEGSHDDLMARGGIYADLYRLQFEGGKAVIDREGTAALAPQEPAETDRPPSWLRRMTQRLIG
jgi:ATP-binding cassette subfamily B protein